MLRCQLIAAFLLVIIFTCTPLSFAGAPAPVAATGVTDGDISGDDGDTQAGIALPQPRFTDNSDGTVTDHLTGLIWWQQANCVDAVNWLTALDTVERVNNGTLHCNVNSGDTDWRLPNIRELMSLTNYDCAYPAISNAVGSGCWNDDPTPFSNISGKYWASTPNQFSINVDSTSWAWQYNSDDGTTFYDGVRESGAARVWGVRGFGNSNAASIVILDGASSRRDQ